MKEKVVLLVGAAFSANLHMDGYSRCADIISYSCLRQG